jgi:hypothetical protein
LSSNQELNNIQTVINTLEMLPEKLNSEILNIILDQIALIVALAQVNCRVDTGTLQNTIHAEITLNNNEIKQVTIKAGGPAAPYAPIIEAKYPFLYPAIEQVKPSLDEQLQTKIQGVIDGSKQ